MLRALRLTHPALRTAARGPHLAPRYAAVCVRTISRGIATERWKKYPFDPAGALDEHGHIPAAPYDLSPLPGSAPEYQTHLILLPREYPHPDTTWPSHIDAACPLHAELSSRARQGGSLEGYGLSFASSDTTITPNGTQGLSPWDPHRAAAMRSPPNQAVEDETFTLYAYRTPGLFVEYPEPLSLRTLPSGEALRKKLDALFARPEARLDSETHIFVCTHGTRDCRCGVVGTELREALQQKVQEHIAQCKQDGSEPARRVRVLDISHVGGHKVRHPHTHPSGLPMPSYTPTAIGTATSACRMHRTSHHATDPSLLLRAALAPASSRHDLQDLRERLVVWPRWRGRLGMSSQDAREHMNLWGPPVVYSAQIAPRARGAPAAAPPPSAAASTAPADAAPDAPSSRTQATHAPLRFHGYDGQWYDVEGIIGETLMETAKRHDLPSIEATCGGELECATCHAYLCDAQRKDPQARGDVDHVPAEADALFGPMSDEEDDMLEYAIDRRASSRLTCQITVSRRIAEWMEKGGRVELPRY